MIRLVCFDLGGVLLRICRSWEEGCAAAGLDVRDVSAAFGGHHDAREAIHDAHQRGEITGEAFAAGLSELANGIYSAEEIYRIHDAWTVGVYDGVTELVRRLVETPVETAILSNTSHEHWVTFPAHPFFSLIRHPLASHLLGVRKPNHEAYRAVEAATGTSGSEILFFDDLTENTSAASELGWHATTIDPHTETVPQIESVLFEHGVLPRPTPSS